MVGGHFLRKRRVGKDMLVVYHFEAAEPGGSPSIDNSSNLIRDGGTPVRMGAIINHA
eukprot:CAMPEP_0171941514 /NCGR_PEP_ID=MMETSP0993-20121228/37922_1 /TAXON_ID=483369 /ORGANISM="non described non described, Strain CCMP2098" /LENGTH=56 /DNA_ID=CAMNT_0012583767 /DNA_START=68 /DNA_END=238 /DNA_ORIENTATION=+